MLIALLFCSQILHSYENGSKIEHPKKLTIEQLKEKELSLSNLGEPGKGCAYKAEIEKVQSQTRDKVANFLPFISLETVKNITEYMNPYSGKWQRIKFCIADGSKKFRNQLFADVPYRYSNDGAEIICNYDVYAVYIKHILNVQDMSIWPGWTYCCTTHPLSLSTNHIFSKDIERSVCNKHYPNLISDSLVEHDEKNNSYTCKISNPSHFPLILKYQQKNAISRDSMFLGFYEDDAYGYSIKKESYYVLKKQCNLNYTQFNLVFFCNTCNGRIDDASKGFGYLLKKHPHLKDESQSCTGTSPLCRTVRPLHVNVEYRPATLPFLRLAQWFCDL